MGSQFNPAVQRRLMREVAALRSDPPEGVRVVVDDENVTNLVGIIQGPENTPYEGGYFRVKFQFTDEFPAAPPKCWFTTKLFHPNVSRAGEICVNTLKKDWLPTHTLAHILTVVKCLLIYPNPESALDDDAGKLLLENYDDYCARARIVTQVHATPKTRPAEFDESKRESSTPPSTSTARASAETENVPAPSSAASSSKGIATSTATIPLQQSTNAPAPAPAAGTEVVVAKTIGVKRPATTTIDKRKKALKRL
ncbi:ubiquitin-conjugating enzyme/RWD-like protein [Auriculariales sp. MPI-PUGE-AT-0066]|nr:ubiquitin-conjugating enzyme/RWD-like protein [Auriculariales sp. MPI-PUGE-AT-0066]